MRKREKVPATSGQVGEITGVLVGEMSFSKDEAKAVIGNLGAFRKDARAFYAKYRAKDISLENIGELGRWAKVYEKLFGKVPNFSGLAIPAKPENLGPMRLIVVAKEIVDWTGNRPLQGTQNALKKHFKCYQYTDDLDESVLVNARDPRKGTYALWVKDIREADEENANKSANDLARDNHLGITILERQLLEMDYFEEHGEHMDLNNVTLCSGSRFRDGRVVGADWGDVGFSVRWYYPSDRDSYLRSRSVNL